GVAVVAIFPGDLIRDVSRHIKCAAASRKADSPQPTVPNITGAIPPIKRQYGPRPEIWPRPTVAASGGGVGYNALVEMICGAVE
ncbi:MAG: hypothetical protein ACP5QA_06270, partial [Phycisphaerae bacterium]